MSETNGKVIDLRSLQNAIAGKVELNDGVHDVRKLTAEQYQIVLGNQEADEATQLALSIDMAAECTGIPIEAIRKFPPDAIRGIVTLAGAGVAAVEKLFPNGNSPEASTSPGSSPPTT